jgi:hypothetical protein
MKLQRVVGDGAARVGGRKKRDKKKITQRRRERGDSRQGGQAQRKYGRRRMFTTESTENTEECGAGPRVADGNCSSRLMRELSTDDYSMSIGMYGLAFE